MPGVYKVKRRNIVNGSISLPYSLSGVTTLDFSSINSISRSKKISGFFRKKLFGQRAIDNDQQEITAIRFTDSKSKYFPGLFNIENIPHNVTEIDLSGFIHLKSLDLTGYEKLTNLNLSNCRSLTDTSLKIPTGVTEVNFSGCYELSNLDLSEYRNLKKINLSICRSLTSLILPESATDVDVSYCEKLSDVDLTKCPNLEKINLSRCKSLTSLILPESATSVDLSECAKLSVIDLTKCHNLEKINLSKCKSLTFPINLPSSVTDINLSHCNIVDSDLKEYANITKIDLSGCASLRSLKNIPKGITKLNVSGCRSLTIPDLTIYDQLAELDISGCDLLPASFKNFPTNILNLVIFNCRSLTSLDLTRYTRLNQLSLNCKNLSNLNIAECKDLVEITLFDCGKLINLNLNGCDKLAKVNLAGSKSLASLTNIPLNITHLNLSGCAALSNLDFIGYNNLNKLNLSNCTSLTSLTNIPASITKLNISGCSNLSTLDLEGCDKLTEVDFSRCDHLQFDAKLRKQITALEAKGCVVRLPLNFKSNNAANDAAIKRLNDIIARSNKDDNLDSIKNLFNRFLVEATASRGNAEHLATEVMPFLDFVEQNPQSLKKWINSIAGNYLEGCVNQPVAGFANIMSWISVAEKDSVADKAEAAKRVMAQKALIEFISRLPEERRPKAGLEVELGNVLLRETHEALLREKIITNPWIGIPKGEIAYQASLRGILTKDLLNGAKDKMKKALKCSSKELCDFLCSSESNEIWRSIAYPEKVEAIEKAWQTKGYFVESLIAEVDTAKNFKSLIEVKITEAVKEGGDREILEEFAQELLSLKSPEEIAKTLLTKQEEIPTQIFAELTKMNHDLTKELFNVPRTNVLPSGTHPLSGTHSRANSSQC